MRASFKTCTRRADSAAGATINVATSGRGTPLLLLHGYPETHHMWHKVAPALAEKFTVVCPDLRGYGDSSKPEGAPDHSNYSKRAMADDTPTGLLGELRTSVLKKRVGHDRDC